MVDGPIGFSAYTPNPKSASKQILARWIYIGPDDISIHYAFFKCQVNLCARMEDLINEITKER